MFQSVIRNQLLPFICPEPVIGPFRGADRTYDHKMQIAAMTAIRLALVIGIYKCAQKADPGRVSAVFGGLFSAPAAGMYWGAKALYKGAQGFKQAVTERNYKHAFWGSGYWVGGCLLLQISQTISYKGWRWGAVELVVNKHLTKDIEYRGWNGY
ncbi:MAG: hypothetical protein KDK64_01230 [Chlamydiia bacterium]|nr:hypothetical protein [Chlamydiia bacterium]